MGLLALLRNEGGSFGTSMSQTIEQRRLQFHSERISEFLDPFNPNVTGFLEQGQSYFHQQTGDPAASEQMALQALQNLVEQQAASLAYFDVFWVSAVLGAALVLLVPLMKRSVAEKGGACSAGVTERALRATPLSRLYHLPIKALRNHVIRCVFHASAGSGVG